LKLGPESNATLLSHKQARQGSLNRGRTAGAEGRITIKWFLKKKGLRVLTGFICLRIDHSAVYVYVAMHEEPGSMKGEHSLSHRSIGLFTDEKDLGIFV
jgi:hypothetical protein